jgi:hypothetical protein
VPADILAQGDKPLIRLPEGGRMHGAGFAIERLGGRKRGDRCADHFGRNAQFAIDQRRFAHRLFETLDATEPASGGSGEMAPPINKRVTAAVGEPHPQLDAEFARHDIESLDIIRRRDDAFGEAEPDGKVFEIARRRHHHRMGDAVVGQRDCRLFGDGALAGTRLAIAPSRSAGAVGRCRQGTHHSAASTSTRAMRRDCFACAS